MGENKNDERYLSFSCLDVNKQPGNFGRWCGDWVFITSALVMSTRIQPQVIKLIKIQLLGDGLHEHALFRVKKLRFENDPKVFDLFLTEANLHFGLGRQGRCNLAIYLSTAFLTHSPKCRICRATDSINGGDSPPRAQHPVRVKSHNHINQLFDSYYIHNTNSMRKGIHPWLQSTL